MASKKDRESQKEYKYLKLQYAVENYEIRQLFKEWILKKEKLIEFERKWTWRNLTRTDKQWTELRENADKGYESLSNKLIELKIKYDDPKDMYNNYCQITGRKKIIEDYEIESLKNDEINEMQHWLIDGRHLVIEIDLFKSTEFIQKQINKIMMKTLQPMFCEITDITPRRQQDIKKYKRYLRVYRLVQEKGEKWTEIAKEIFPEDFISDEELLKSDSDDMSEPNRPSARTKVHNDYKEAKRLIQEGLP